MIDAHIILDEKEKSVFRKVSNWLSESLQHFDRIILQTAIIPKKIKGTSAIEKKNYNNVLSNLSTSCFM